MLQAQLLKRLSSPSTSARTEADIQSDIKTLLMSGDFGLDEARLEVQVGDGTRRRIDIAIGATVIEVKRTLTTEDAAAEHIAQLAGYVETKSRARPPDGGHGGFDQEADFRIAGPRSSNTTGARYLHQECRRTVL